MAIWLCRRMEDRLRDIQSLTDNALSRLDEQEFLAGPLDRVRDILHVDAAALLQLAPGRTATAVQSITTWADRAAAAARPYLSLCVMIGLAIDGGDTVGYHRKKDLQPLIRAHFSPLAIIQDALNASRADPA